MRGRPIPPTQVTSRKAGRPITPWTNNTSRGATRRDPNEIVDQQRKEHAGWHEGHEGNGQDDVPRPVDRGDEQHICHGDARARAEQTLCVVDRGGARPR